MARLIFLCIAAIVIWSGIRAIRRKMGCMYAELCKAEDRQSKKEKIQPLKKDRDGVYRLKDD